MIFDFRFSIFDWAGTEADARGDRTADASRPRSSYHNGVCKSDALHSLRTVR